MTGRVAENASHADGDAVNGNSVGALWARVRRYWVLVLAVTWVTTLGAVYATKTAPTTYEGRTSLIVSSNDRSPDQDAVLVQGYIAYFNDSSYQQQLLRSAGIRGDVSLSAEAAAASPILVISATTDDPTTAQSSAIEVSSAFREDINRIQSERTARELVDLQDQLDTARASNNPGAQDVIANLQNRIQEVKADQVNVLQDLQAQGGVSVQSPSLFGNLLPAVAGGLLIGVLAALGLSRMSQRLHNGRDVADKIGLRTLVELPRPRRGAGRTQQARRLGQLANIARARLAGPGAVAVAQPEEGVASAMVARELAQEWAAQGYPTVLVRTGAAGVLDASGAAAPQIRSVRLQGLSVLELAPLSAYDAPVLSVSKVSELLQQETRAGQYVVIEAPAVAQSPAAQAICHAADQTILVVDPQVTRVPIAREAVAVLRQMGVQLQGAVVASVRKEREEEAPETPTTPNPGPSDEAPPENGRPPIMGLRQDAESGRA